MALDSEVQRVVLILTQLEKCRKSDEDAALPFSLQDGSFAGLQCLGMYNVQMRTEMSHCSYIVICRAIPGSFTHSHNSTEDSRELYIYIYICYSYIDKA